MRGKGRTRYWEGRRGEESGRGVGGVGGWFWEDVIWKKGLNVGKRAVCVSENPRLVLLTLDAKTFNEN